MQTQAIRLKFVIAVYVPYEIRTLIRKNTSLCKTLEKMVDMYRVVKYPH